MTATTLPSLSASGRVVTTIVPGWIRGLMTCDRVSVCTPTRTGTAWALLLTTTYTILPLGVCATALRGTTTASTARDLVTVTVTSMPPRRT